MDRTFDTSETWKRHFLIKTFYTGADTGFKGGGQDFLGTKKLIIRNQKSCRRRKFLLT